MLGLNLIWVCCSSTSTHISTNRCYLPETLNLKFNSLPKSCVGCSGRASMHTMYFHIFVLIEAVYWFFFWFWKLRERHHVTQKTDTLSLPVNKFVVPSALVWSYMSHSYQGGVTSTLGVNGPEVTYARESQKYEGRTIRYSRLRRREVAEFLT